MTARLSDTDAAAIQHEFADVPADATLVGVVRHPTAWFHPLVDENHPALGPPEDLLSTFQDRREDLADRIRAGEDLALVCHENTDNERCHRTVLRDLVEKRT